VYKIALSDSTDGKSYRVFLSEQPRIFGGLFRDFMELGFMELGFMDLGFMDLEFRDLDS